MKKSANSSRASSKRHFTLPKGVVPAPIDRKKIAAYKLTAEDYAEIPELDDDFAEKAAYHVGGMAMPKPKRGRPTVSGVRKIDLKLRLDPTIVDFFKAEGPGYQTRINNALLKHVKGAGRVGSKAIVAKKAAKKPAKRA
jgi:uncharacterized protein (DUF4415 family)